ncbi:hypothetical protein CsSME_00045173 [Camellia sinensis var. sinensis]
MDKRPRNQAKTTTSSTTSEEVSSIEWEFIKMTSQEEDIINRMYRLVGDRYEKFFSTPTMSYWLVLGTVTVMSHVF